MEQSNPLHHLLILGVELGSRSATISYWAKLAARQGKVEGE